MPIFQVIRFHVESDPQSALNPVSQPDYPDALAPR